MKKIAVVTATRAEYGLISPVVDELRKYENESVRIDLIVTGTHLYKEFGNTVQDIKQRIDRKILIPVSSSSELEISNNQSVTLVKFTELFEKEKYEGVVVLGDRYEMLMVAIAAGNTKTPIFHLCGGDTTEGAIDEWIRHSITKISYLHFPTNEESKHRIIQMGEDPSRVFNYGSTSIDNILNMNILSKEEALKSVNLELCDYALCTYHPVTMEEGQLEKKIDSFIQVIKDNNSLQFIVTKSNADRGGEYINSVLDEAEKKIGNLHVHASLGVLRYLSLMKHAKFVLGNSSSGIVETPAFKIPTINIGDRQRGRLQSPSIINCGSSKEEIAEAIKKAQNQEFLDSCKTVGSPYGDGTSAVKISKKIMDVISEGKIDLKKKFYNIEFKEQSNNG